MNAALAIAAAILWSIVERAKKGLMIDLGTAVLAAVEEAERKWVESGRGADKKAWAISTVMAWLTARLPLNWWQRFLVQIAVGNLIDAVIGEVNERLGKDWRSKAEAYLEQWTGVDLPDAAGA